MSLYRQIRYGLETLFRRATADREVDEEAGHYFDELVRDLETQGLSPEQARRAARIEIGGAISVREQVRDAGWESALWGIIEDCRYAARRLQRRPGFAAAAVLTLALGIGATVAVFAVVDAVLLRPLPFPHSDRLVALRQAAPGVNLKDVRMSASLYFTYRDEARVFEEIAIWNGRRATVSGVGIPEEARTLFVTHEFLNVLGVRPAIGRGFTAIDGDPGSAGTVLLSDGYWRRRFGANPGVIGRTILIDGNPHEIIGILPPSFEFLDESAALIAVERLDRNKVPLIRFDSDGIARLRQGVTLRQADADLARCIPLAAARFPLNSGLPANAFAAARITPQLQFLKDQLVGDLGATLWTLLGAVAILMMIACANVANLELVRADARKQELALRAALGANRFRIARDLLAESVVLGIAGAAAGLAIGWAALRLITNSGLARLPRIADASVGIRAVLFALAASLLTSIFFGLIPVWKYAFRRPLDPLIRGGERTSSLTRERRRGQQILVVVQVALAMMLLVGSGLMIRTFQELRDVDPGFTSPEQVQGVRVSIPPTLSNDPEAVTRLEQQILRRFESVPGVLSAAITTSLPMDGGPNEPVFVADHPVEQGKLPPVRRTKEISPGFFKSIGSRFLAGRDFTWDELYRAAPVALISENMARELWGSPRAALHGRIRESHNQEWSTIVGVVADLRDAGIAENAPTMVYWPLMRRNMSGMVGASRHVDFTIRSPRAGTTPFVRELEQALQEVSASLPLANVRTLQSLYRRSLSRTSLALILLAGAGIMALALAIVGVYGVIAYSVAQRKKDIGIRMALGASGRRVSRAFLREGFALSAVGVVFGLAAASAATEWMRSLLFGVAPLDPMTYAAAVPLLLLPAVLASWLPARRAARLDPLEVLRSQ